MADLLSILRQAGFSGQSLNTAYAIAMAESGGNARAFNGNTGTGDQSYGLFQINMHGGMGPERRKQFGLSSNDDLYDAVRNAQVAFKMSKGGTDWSPWSTYSSGVYKNYMGKGQTANMPYKGGAGGATDMVDKPAGDILGTGNIGPGLAAPSGDPFAPQQSGDPFAAPKQQQQTVPGQNPMGAQGAGSTSMRDKIIATAMQQLGTPYSWGGGGLGGASRGFAQGAGTVGFDCSSLLMYAFGKNGYSLPRVSYEQLKRGERTSVSALRPGDLVGFRDGSHIALYIGGGKILEAPHTGATVRVRQLGANEDAWGVRLNLPGD